MHCVYLVYVGYRVKIG